MVVIIVIEQVVTTLKNTAHPVAKVLMTLNDTNMVIVLKTQQVIN